MVLTMTKNSMKIPLLALILTGSVSLFLLAQSSRLQYADKQYELANYRLAADEYAKSYAVKQDYATAKKAAQSLDAIYAYSESYSWWKKAVSYSSEVSKEDYSALVKAGYRSVQNYNPTDDLRGSSYGVGDFEEFFQVGPFAKLSPLQSSFASSNTFDNHVSSLPFICSKYVIALSRPTFHCLFRITEMLEMVGDTVCRVEGVSFL